MRATGHKWKGKLDARGPRDIQLEPFPYTRDSIFSWYRKSQAKIFKFKVHRNGKLALTNGLNEHIVLLRLF